MPSRNVDGDQREARVEVDRRPPGQRAGKRASPTSRTHLPPAAEAVSSGDRSIGHLGDRGPTGTASDVGGRAIFGEAADDGTGSTVLARLESVCRTPEQDAKMQAVGQLAGSVAHDFNNIFTAVLGNLQLLQRRAGDNRRIRQMADAAIEASLRGTDLANQLLAFSHRREMESRVFDANAVLIGLEKALKRTVGRKIEIGTRLMDGSWKVETDAAHLEAAILNLAVNAREAMPEGGRLTIETTNIVFGDLATWRPALGAQNYVRISVGDTGCGMARDQLERIFEPFFTTKPPARHAGLGLNVVSAFVEESRGLLTVGSVPGKGTRFNIFLPAALTAASATGHVVGGDAGKPSVPA